jgi:hypothetical protein
VVANLRIGENFIRCASCSRRRCTSLSSASETATPPTWHGVAHLVTAAPAAHAASSRELNLRLTMLVSAMRPRRVCSFGYARTSRSGEPFALDSRMTAYRTLEGWSNALITSLVSPLLFQASYASCSCKRNSKRDSGIRQSRVRARQRCGVQKTFPVLPLNSAILKATEER